eukprot:1177762-Prorocentrum_minimum.AAC.1
MVANDHCYDNCVTPSRTRFRCYVCYNDLLLITRYSEKRDADASCDSRAIGTERREPRNPSKLNLSFHLITAAAISFETTDTGSSQLRRLKWLNKQLTDGVMCNVFLRQACWHVREQLLDAGKEADMPADYGRLYYILNVDEMRRSREWARTQVLVPIARIHHENIPTHPASDWSVVGR